jgi:hypothetical protein
MENEASAVAMTHEQSSERNERKLKAQELRRLKDHHQFIIIIPA